MKRAVVLYSGGTDSTLVAALAAESHDTVRLLTLRRLGIFHIDHSVVNVRKLREKYGHDRFAHHIIGIDRLFRKVSYSRYLPMLLRHGFFVLSTCGLCKLSMHIRAVIYCLENDIANVYDGANQGMITFPAQMKDVIVEIRKMYARFGIRYESPVFDFDDPPRMEFGDRLVERMYPEFAPDRREEINTTENKLYELGLAESPRLKGTRQDHMTQPRCFQFVLSNILIDSLYLSRHSYDEYVDRTVSFFGEKIDYMSGLIDEYLVKGEGSELYGIVDR